MALTVQNRVWSIPELIKFIARSLSRSDCSRLARTTRLCFHNLVEYIWFEVDGAINLLTLLPGAELITVMDDGSSTLEQLALPNQPDLDFTRFSFYAPLVKRLEVFRDGSYGRYANSWNGLISHTSENTLLPNLELLSVVCDTASADNALQWLSMFISPGLTTVELFSGDPGYPPQISYPSASRVLDKITRHCPLLETLSICPSIMSTESNPAAGMLLMPYEYFGRAHHISTLTVGRDIFRPAFLQAVGSLPCLTNLRIHNFDFRTESLPDVTLSSESFPVLRKMTIDDFCPALLVGIFNYLPLVRNVTTLFMRISDPLDLVEFENTTLFSAIARASPSIDDLCINFDYDADFKALDLAALSPLPLRTLSLSTCDITIGSPHDFCPILANSFPQLQRLIMPAQDAYFWDLCWFTELKQLEYLSVMVYWWPSEKRSHSKDSPSQSSSKLHTLECDISRPRTFDI